MQKKHQAFWDFFGGDLQVGGGKWFDDGEEIDSLFSVSGIQNIIIKFS